MIKYPTLIVNNFFENPNKIVEYSKTLEYNRSDWKQKNTEWPGVRTKSINYFNFDLFKFIFLKTLSYYYSIPEMKEFNLTGKAFFSKTTKEDKKLYKKNEEIHKDLDSKLAGVIFLNKENDIKSGTTIYDDKLKVKLKTSNLFNSMICYDSNEYHGPSSLLKDRLTIPFFIDTINFKSPYDKANEVKGF